MMAGKFLSLEEAARRLGVGIDEVNRLVDRKELFPMRDGATIKFKVDEIERVAADLGVGATDDDDLSLELSSPGLGGSLLGPGSGGSGGDLALGEAVDEESIFAADDGGGGAVAGSQTVVRGGAPALGSGTFDVDDLALESIVGASSPSLGIGDAKSPPADSGTLAIDLSNLGFPPRAGSVVRSPAPSTVGSPWKGENSTSRESTSMPTSGWGRPRDRRLRRSVAPWRARPSNSEPTCPTRIVPRS